MDMTLIEYVSVIDIHIQVICCQLGVQGHPNKYTELIALYFLNL